MEPVSPALTNVLWLPIAILFFLVPGWLLSRRLRSPAPEVSAFLTSAALLFNWVLVLNAARIPIHAGTLGLGFGCFSLVLVWRMPRLKVQKQPRSRAYSPRQVNGWYFVIPVLFALGSISVRSVIDPLSGLDNISRWDYLARLFLARGSLAGYPPMTNEDFEYYSWCDGIPPLIPLLNLWIYAFTGSIAPALTAGRVIGETVLLGGVVFRYSRLIWGAQGGMAALATLSTSALAIWSISMGQETGITAIALVSMLYFLELYARTPTLSLVFWAGLAAGIGGITREYGLSFFVLGLAQFVARRQNKSHAAIYTAATFSVCAPWYFRNWLITGNPLYPQTLGGMFPGNPVHDEIMSYISDERSFFFNGSSPAYFLPLLACVAGVVIILGMVGAWKAQKNGYVVVGGIALVTLLWLWSISQTGGGWIYSTRVLSPGLALFAVLSGWVGTVGAKFRLLCALTLVAGAADAARRSWLVPISPLISPFNISLSAWHEHRSVLRLYSSPPELDVLIRVAGEEFILVDNVAHHAYLTIRGGNAIAIFSPLVRASLFDSRASLPNAVAKLRAAGVRFITISPGSTRLVQKNSILSELYLRYAPSVDVESLVAFDLERLVPARTAPLGPP